MNKYKFLSYLLILCMIAASVQSCKDDFGYSDAGLTDGMASVSLRASFSPFAEGNLTRSIDQVGGEALKDIQDLVILVYDAKADSQGNHQLLEQYCLWDAINISGVTVDGDTPRTDEDASNGVKAETTTASVSGITMALPYGDYYLVGVANLKGGTESYLKSNPDECKTLDGLLRMRMSWDERNISRNGEMMGYFTSVENKNVPSFQSSIEPISVRQARVSLHSWLRRCASKITIDFDGSNLRENVYIYIKEARIFDLSKDCTLGFGNPLDQNDADYNNTVKEGDGFKSPYTSDEDMLSSRPYQVITYGSGVYTNWPLITKGTPYVKNVSSSGSDEEYEKAERINFHSETANALYFYENMQGEPEGATKLPVANILEGEGTPVGGLVYNNKDGVEEGTFIEVTGFYHSDASGSIGSGVVKYRFMLGKDALKNFDAERNYHYKLTLKFNGNANDYDWHINYKDRPGFNVPNPWYVSYLYNHDASLPFKFTPDENWELVNLEAEIIDNPWYPTGIEDDSQLTNPMVPLTIGTPFGDETAPYKTQANKSDGNGFLSLRVSTETVITDEMAGTAWPESGGYSQAAMQTINENYYKGRTESNPLDMSYRKIMDNGRVIVQPDDYPAGFDQKYKDRETIAYQINGDSYSFNIPLFTRSKVMVKQTGYSGNNPFVGYERVGRIQLTAHQVNKTTGATKAEVGYVNVVQVRRIVNPKGVYRASGNNEPFDVQLMTLKGDDREYFDELRSHGPWKADIIGDANFITLDGKQTVSGSTNSLVKFTIQFNRMNSDPDDKTVRNACVRVRYNNFTCTHLIFVRQGYEPVRLSDESSTYWRTFNMITADRQATDPRDEGSLFKYGNVEQPIDAINNVYWYQDGTNRTLFYHNLTDQQFKDGTMIYNVLNPFSIEDPDGDLISGFRIAKENDEWSDSDIPVSWADIKDRENYSDIDDFSDGIGDAATMADFQQLYLLSNIEFGYGVLYADGARSTQKSIADAYGYYRGDPNCAEKGMRGLFIYHWNGDENSSDAYNATNVFFPIGRSGYGHRKAFKEGSKGNEVGNGILRYACARGAYNDMFNTVGPLFASIYRREGAIYWAKTPTHNYKEWNGVNGNSVAYGLDINYFSYDVNAITETNISRGQDACFVRCVGAQTSPASAPRKGRRR